MILFAPTTLRKRPYSAGVRGDIAPAYDFAAIDTFVQRAQADDATDALESRDRGDLASLGR